MPKNAGKVLRFILRWTIAVVGVTWVLSNIHLRDRIRVLDENNLPVEVRLISGDESSQQFEYFDPATGATQSAERDRVINPSDQSHVELVTDGKVSLLGMRLVGDIDQNPVVRDLLIRDKSTGAGRFVGVHEVKDFELNIPHPLVEVGAMTMVKRADTQLLIAAVAVMPLTYLFTTIRWHLLLNVLGISITRWRAFVINMVGSFYNTFMLGTAGGDVLKAYYAARQAPTRRTAAVMSVIVDRAIGLLTLIILGGSMAALQYATSEDRTDAVSQRCLQVAISAAILLTGALAFSVIVYWRGLRQTFRLNALMTRMPMQKQVQKIVEVVRVYRQQPMLIFGTIIMTFPVHLTVVVSAMLAGKAFDLPISTGYYFIVVPVVVLVGAVPLSPQGAGVMEAFAFYLTRSQGATVNQALALTISIRLVAMIWNLLGGVFVLKGGYHTPTEQEKSELESNVETPHSNTPVQM